MNDLIVLSDETTDAEIIEVEAIVVSDSAKPPVVTRGEDLLDNRLAVAALLAAAGPIGLPALWLSRSFSKTTKTVTTILLLLLTVVFPLAVTWYFLDVAMRPLLDAMSDALSKT